MKNKSVQDKSTFASRMRHDGEASKARSRPSAATARRAGPDSGCCCHAHERCAALQQLVDGFWPISARLMPSSTL
jgi:hypothetical protein